MLFDVYISYTGNFRSIVHKSRRESAHACNFGGGFELKILRMCGFSLRFLDNGPEISRDEGRRGHARTL